MSGAGCRDHARPITLPRWGRLYQNREAFSPLEISRSTWSFPRAAGCGRHDAGREFGGRGNIMDMISLFRQRFPTRSAPLAAIVGVLAVLAACERIDDAALYGRPDRRAPAVPQPIVQRDLDAIRTDGTLRMLTRYNATSYFVHRGGEAGFDYELCQRFARARELALEVVIPEADEDLVSLLNSGRADVVCAGLTLTDDLSRYVEATRPVAMVQKVVVLAPGVDVPTGEADLDGLTLTLPAHDPYLDELKRWRDRVGLDLAILPGMPLVETEELIARTARGEIQGTVADDIVVAAVQSYLEEEVRRGPALGQPRPMVWLVRGNSPELLRALNAYLKESFRVTGDGTWRSQTYGIIYDRYFRNPRSIRTFQSEEARPDLSGRISRFDELVRAQSEEVGLDWRLVTALIYQESRFYPRAVSKAGARGLMQVMPHLGGAQSDSLFDPAANLRAGLRLLRGSWDAYAYLDSLDRLRFTLAAYHAGVGHVTDARRMAMDVNLDPNRWEGGLAITLPRKAQRRWYTDTRHGYYRGDETVRYVEEILNRYRMYMRLVPLDPDAPAPSDSLATTDADSAAFAAMPDAEVPGDGEPPPEGAEDGDQSP
ncbi:transglycosylase SLT domain-containing protein [bacterium]|nr:transglycosylase SLT domain-containing protein [bacterium]